VSVRATQLTDQNETLLRSDLINDTPKSKIAKSYASPDPVNRNTRPSKASTTRDSPSSRNWRAEVQQNSRKASILETGGSIKSPAIDNFEASEFMTIKPTKLDLTDEQVDKEFA
jgi:hypothetical protein